MTNQEAIKECVCFCDFCIKAWKENKRETCEIQEAIAVCTICESFLCEAHSLYESDTEIRRCRDQRMCRVVAPEQDEGGGD